MITILCHKSKKNQDLWHMYGRVILHSEKTLQNAPMVCDIVSDLFYYFTSFYALLQLKLNPRPVLRKDGCPASASLPQADGMEDARLRRGLILHTAWLPFICRCSDVKDLGPKGASHP